jgi:hyperosmotically inducible periplasmic protein
MNMSKKPSPYSDYYGNSDRGVILVGRLIALVLILVLIAGIVYFVYQRGLPGGQRAVGDSLRGAMSTAGQSAENAATTARVKVAYALSRSVSAFDIGVETHNGVVTLTGQVPSEQASRLAEQIARQTSGVDDVVNQLGIDPAVQPDAEREQLGTRVADLELRTQIADSLAADPELRGEQVSVESRDGQVLLSGEVETERRKQRAERIAWGHPDARQVDNRLTVRTEEGVETTDRLGRRVEFELYSSRAFDLENINVRTDNATVILSGTVRSPAERMLAERITRDVDGVRNVQNRLSVESPQAPSRTVPPTPPATVPR